MVISTTVSTKTARIDRLHLLFQSFADAIDISSQIEANKENEKQAPDWKEVVSYQLLSTLHKRLGNLQRNIDNLTTDCSISFFKELQLFTSITQNETSEAETSAMQIGTKTICVRLTEFCEDIIKLCETGKQIDEKQLTNFKSDAKQVSNVCLKTGRRETEQQWLICLTI